MYGCDDDTVTKMLASTQLYDVIKTRYMDFDGKVFPEYLIENTSSEERKKKTKFLMCERRFSREAFQKYVDGEYEINVAFEKMEKCIYDQIDKELEKTRKKQEHITKKRVCQTNRRYLKIQHFLHNMQAFEDYNERKLMDIKKGIDQFIEGLDKNKQVDRLMRFYLECAEEALDNKNGEMIEELSSDWKRLHTFFEDKIDIDEIECTDEKDEQEYFTMLANSWRK